MAVDGIVFAPAFLILALGAAAALGLGIAGTRVRRRSKSLPVALEIGEDRLVAWYDPTTGGSNFSLSRTLLFANVIGIAGGRPSLLVDRRSTGLDPARVTGYLEPGPGPSEGDLAFSDGDIQDVEGRGRPAGAIYLTKENSDLVSRAYRSWAERSGQPLRS